MYMYAKENIVRTFVLLHAVYS